MIKHMLSMPILNGSMGKWILVLSEFDLKYESAKAVEGQIMADFVIHRYVQLKRLTLLRRDQHRWTFHILLYLLKHLLLHITAFKFLIILNLNKGENGKILSNKFEMNLLMKLILPSRDCNSALVVGGTASSIAFLFFLTNFDSSLVDYETQELSS